jgi:hypothetical protein
MLNKDNPLGFLKSLTGGGLLGAGLLGILQSQHLIPFLDLHQAMSIGACIGGATHKLLFDAFLSPAFLPIKYYSRLLELHILVERRLITLKEAKMIKEQLTRDYFLGDLRKNSLPHNKKDP